MWRRALLSGLLITTAAGSIDLGACGDKFLRAGRSGRLKHYAAMYPASIVLYQSATAKPAVVKQWQTMLKQAGHKPVVVRTGDELSRTVASAQYDVVIAAYQDAENVNSALQVATSKPGVLPVVSSPTKVLTQKVKQQYEHLINTEMDRYDALEEIDRLMESRSKRGAAASK